MLFWPYLMEIYSIKQNILYEIPSLEFFLNNIQHNILPPELPQYTFLKDSMSRMF